MGNMCGVPQDRTMSRRISRIPSYSPIHDKLRKDASVREVYKIGRTIGTGGFSVVKLATERETGKIWACKIMTLPPPGRKVSDGESTREDIFKEIDILMSLGSDCIIYLKEYFEEGSRVYIIMEYLAGGELLEALLSKEKGSDGSDAHYSEDDARVIFKQLMQGVKYMHDIGIVHRDLKLENLLLAKPNDINTIKIADFGLAKKYGQSSLSTICGTPQYVAPEVIKGGSVPYTYGKECDLWSTGIILFILLGGYPPFYDESEPRLFRKIREGKYDMNDPVWKDVSSEAKDLIAKLLTVDASKRLTAEQVFEHPWMQEKGEQITRGLLQTVSKMRSSMRQIQLGAMDGAPTGGGLIDMQNADQQEGWRSYFEQREFVACPSRNIQFNVYKSGSGSGPVLLCIHGGGSTALTWALVAVHLKAFNCQVIAPDLRAHGLTIAEDEKDFSAETLSLDIAHLWSAISNSSKVSNRPVILVGHSMGGALAVHSAKLSSFFPTLKGVVVIDVVEGTALASLPFMKTLLSRRPTSFACIDSAIEWAVHCGASKKKESARISIPPMLIQRNKNTNSCDDSLDVVNSRRSASPGGAHECDVILETDEEEGNAGSEFSRPPCMIPRPPPPIARHNRDDDDDDDDDWKDHPDRDAFNRIDNNTKGNNHGDWVWRTRLIDSAPYWDGWYKGLSESFLSLLVNKMLVLAGTDRLDRTLTIGQMQGKFQLILLPGAGHAVQEDEPEKVADALYGFLERYRIVCPNNHLQECNVD